MATFYDEVRPLAQHEQLSLLIITVPLLQTDIFPSR